MKFEPKEIMLKNGMTAILRSPEPEDAEKVLVFLQTMCSETDFLLRTAEECNTMTVEKEAEWIRRGLESGDTLNITCFEGGEAVGNCNISFSNRVKTKHRATIGIGIVKSHWNLGIGTAMLSELISVAKARDGIEIAELEFIEGNERARHLYEKTGFRVVSERPDAFIIGGEYKKEFYMQKRLRG